jgi:hypothetical protein
MDFNVRGENQPFVVSGHQILTTGRGAASVHAGPWHFSADGSQPKDLSPRLSIITEATGDLDTQFQVHWGGAGFDGTGRVDMKSLTLKTDTLAVDGLSGDIVMDHLTPLGLDAVQTLVAERIGGVVGLTKARLDFRVADDKLYIVHGEGQISGGQVTLDDQVIDARKDDQSVTLAFANLDLARLFGLLNVEGVSGQGRLSGAVPLTISTDTVTISDGQFAAAGPGVLQLRSKAARNALGSAGEDAAMLLNVLDDFHYQRLDLKLNKDRTGEATIHLSTAGSNPAVMNDQPFVLNVNLTTRIDKVLAVLSKVISLSQKALRDTLVSSP